MPDLDFQVTGAEPAQNGLAPLLLFQLEVTNRSGDERVQSVLLHAQIQVQSPQRTYTPQEKQKLVELFGTPDRWGQTLRNRLWTTVDTTIGAFEGVTGASLFVPCTYDLTFSATKYFYALEEGEVPLLFLFSGTVFYEADDGRLQVQPISWNKECVFRMSLKVWEDLMDAHFPNTAWLYLRRDVFDRLYDFKLSQGHATWEQTIERLLPENIAEKAGTAA